MALFIADELVRIETFLAEDRVAEIFPELQALVASMEAYIDEHCVATDEVQYFSFANAFEKLAYRRIEGDPRALVDVPAPFSRAYARYAFCLAKQHDNEAAVEALRQAVRWNPMDCELRLSLANGMASLGNLDESLNLNHSVFARASRSNHLVRAYLAFAGYFAQIEEAEAAGACVRCALRLDPENETAGEMARELVSVHAVDARGMSDAAVERVLEPYGIPLGANLDVVVCALIESLVVQGEGDERGAAELFDVAADLVGREQAQALAGQVAESLRER